MSDRKFYIEKYSDETVPCNSTLEGWAEWLSKPDPEWRRPEAAKDGETFKANVIRFEADVTATRTASGWEFSRDISDADFLAERWGPGLGWDAESIAESQGLLCELLNEGGTVIGGTVEDIAVGYWEPDVVITYRIDADGKPSCSWVTAQ